MAGMLSLDGRGTTNGGSITPRLLDNADTLESLSASFSPNTYEAISDSDAVNAIVRFRGKLYCIASRPTLPMHAFALLEQDGLDGFSLGEVMVFLFTSVANQNTLRGGNVGNIAFDPSGLTSDAPPSTANFALVVAVAGDPATLVGSAAYLDSAGNPLGVNFANPAFLKDDDGHWDRRDTRTDSVKAFASWSGLHFYTDETGENRLAYFYFSNDGNIYALKSSFTSSRLFFDRTNLGAHGITTFNKSCTKIFCRGKFYFAYRADNQSRISIYDPITDAFETIRLDGLNCDIHLHNFYGHVIFGFGNGTTNNVLFEILPNGNRRSIKSTTFNITDATNSLSAIAFRGTKDDFFVGYRASDDTVRLHRVFRRNGRMVWNGSKSVTANDIGGALLHSSLRSSQTAIIISSVCDDVFNVEGEVTQLLSTRPVAITGTRTVRRVTDPWAEIDSGNTATCKGTFGDADDIEFQNDPSLSIGEFILHENSNQCYRVIGVSGASNELISIENFTGSGITAPTGSSAFFKAVECAGDATYSSTVRAAWPEDCVGGGLYFHSDSPVDASFEARAVFTSPDRERLSFRVYRRFAAMESVNVRAWYKRDHEMIRGNISDVSDGTLDSNEMQGIDADPTTLYWLELDNMPTGEGWVRLLLLDVVV